MLHKARPIITDLQKVIYAEESNTLKPYRLGYGPGVENNSFNSPKMTAVKKDNSIELNPISRKYKNNCRKRGAHMQNLNELMNKVSEIISSNNN